MIDVWAGDGKGSTRRRILAAHTVMLGRHPDGPDLDHIAFLRAIFRAVVSRRWSSLLTILETADHIITGVLDKRPTTRAAHRVFTSKCERKKLVVPAIALSTAPALQDRSRMQRFRTLEDV